MGVFTQHYCNEHQRVCTQICLHVLCEWCPKGLFTPDASGNFLPTQLFALRCWHRDPPANPCITMSQTHKTASWRTWCKHTLRRNANNCVGESWRTRCVNSLRGVTSEARLFTFFRKQWSPHLFKFNQIWMCLRSWKLLMPLLKLSQIENERFLSSWMQQEHIEIARKNLH